jgi:hypothetical protein
VKSVVFGAVVIVLMTTAFSGRASAAGPNFAFESTRFGVALPAGVTASLDSANDYGIYTFKRGARVLLQAYVGNQPIDTVFHEHHQYATFGRINSMPDESIVYAYPGDILSREIIVTLSNAGPWPRFVHMWYLNLSSPEATIADQIISSIGVVSGGAPSKYAARGAQGTAAGWGAPGTWGARAQQLLKADTPKN